ncbi:HIRAN domain-containing protein [Brevundimonas sp.]
MGWFERLVAWSRPKEATPAPRKSTPWSNPLAGVAGLQVVGKGGFPRNAVGESRYQTELKRICGGYNRQGQHLETVARLEPEPTNAFDPNAIMVMISGQKVGYLSRDDAAIYVAALEAAGHAGQTAAVGAKVVGGWRTNQHDAGQFGVRLAMPFPIRFQD